MIWTAEPSSVISAMNGAERALAAVRISLGETTTDEEVDYAIERILARVGPPRSQRSSSASRLAE